MSGLIGRLVAGCRPDDAHDPDAGDVRAALMAGAWAWPAADTEAGRRARAWRRAPAPVVGAVLVLAVDDLRGAAYAVGATDEGRAVAWAPGVRDTWQRAVGAAAASLPLLWRPLCRLEALPPTAHLIGAVQVGSRDGRHVALDGTSAGLAFALSVSSRALNHPLPARFAAVAEVDARGRTAPVCDAGFPGKVAALRAWAPAVDTLLVHPDNVVAAEAAVKATGGDIPVVPVETVAGAIHAVWGDAIAAEIEAQGRAPETRADLVDAVFRLALMPHAAVPAWRPVALAGARALDGWGASLPPDELLRLRVATAIAARHAHLPGQPFPTLPDEMLQRRPLPVRLELVAHAVQACTDTGTPPVEAAMRLVEGHLQVGLEATVGHLKLVGAFGRLQSVTGRTDQALDSARSAARGHFERFAYDQVSYPLCEWLRLAAAAGDVAAFDEASQLVERVRALAGSRDIGEWFMRSAHAYGAARLLADSVAGAPDSAETVRALEGIVAASRGGRSQVRSAQASRALHLLALAEADDAGRARRREALDALEDPTGAWLADLDAGTRGLPDAPPVQVTLDRLQRAAPQTLAHLMAAPLPDGCVRAEYIARYYPY